jgi:hypothetical protein
VAAMLVDITEKEAFRETVVVDVQYPFLGCNHSQENVKTKTWRPCWYHKQKKLMRNTLLTTFNMAAMTSHATEELLISFVFVCFSILLNNKEWKTQRIQHRRLENIKQFSLMGL